jgi:hypothetical protein
MQEEELTPETALPALRDALNAANMLLDRLQAIKRATGGGSRDLSLAITEQETANWRLRRAYDEAERKLLV